MLTNQQISERHPELAELREFKTDEEIVEVFKNGGDVWEVWSSIDGRGGVAGPIKVTGAGTYEGNCEDLRGKPIYFYPLDYAGKKSVHDAFVTDLQNHPTKAVFTSRERAEIFFNAVQEARASDPEWQAEDSYWKEVIDQEIQSERNDEECDEEF